MAASLLIDAVWHTVWATTPDNSAVQIMGEAVGRQDFDPLQLGRVARKRVGHLNGRREFASALLQHVGEVLTRMLPSRKVQCDSKRTNNRYDPAGERAGAPVTRFPRQPQNPHARVVVVHHAALRRLSD